MQKNNRYPRIQLRSKNELAKRISDKSFSVKKSLLLINDVLEKFDKYWVDSKKSQPENGKYIRSAIGTPLGVLLKLINRKVLKPHDHLLPDFIFGGVSNKNHIQAAYALLGKQKNRTLLGLDISRFFEQINKVRVFYFFYKKCGCSAKASQLLADLCCVPEGKKGNGSQNHVLARGFSTSPRLAVWANLDTFVRIKWATDKCLSGHDPKIVIFVDDVGVSASRISGDTIKQLREKIKTILSGFDSNQKLPINEGKTKIKPFAQGVEHLGFRLGRNKINFGYKTKANMERVKKKLKISSGIEKKQLIKKLKSYYLYKKQADKTSDHLVK